MIYQSEKAVYIIRKIARQRIAVGYMKSCPLCFALNINIVDIYSLART